MATQITDQYGILDGDVRQQPVAVRDPQMQQVVDLLFKITSRLFTLLRLIGADTPGE